MTYELELTGCRPEPLMSYLKALGVFRLVAEQKDPKATACWRQDHFVLCTELNETALLDFFLNEYQPAPIATPWAGGSGFFKKDNRDALDAIAQSKTSRLALYREVINRARTILDDEGMAEKPEGEAKERLLRRFRREMPDEFVRWMDAAIVLGREGQEYAPVLGTGGNDGRLDFAQNFMQRLVDKLKIDQGTPPPHAAELLKNSLLGIPTNGHSKAAVGQFAPGRSGGPNATQGMEGDATDNPWDFVLMLEGALMIAGALVHRSGVLSSDKASFPFTVRSRPVGASSVQDSEVANSRGELWLPIWSRFVTLRELELLFSEGRAEFAGRPARDTVDFARAVAQLGVDRGIEQFVRFSFLQRSGKSYFAVAMGRFPVPPRPREVIDLLQEIDLWLVAFRRAAGPDQPARFRRALVTIESAIFDYCRYGRLEDLMAVFLALGRAERELAITASHLRNQRVCSPLGNLSARWIEATYDGSVEYDIALALSGIHDPGPREKERVPPIRANLEPVEWERQRWDWRELSGTGVVWNTADLSTNMAAVLERRILDGKRAACELLPLHSYRPVSLRAVAAFLEPGRCNETRIEELLWSLVLVDHLVRLPPALRQKNRELSEELLPLPRQFALLKLLFLPAPLVAVPSQPNQPPRWRMARRSEPGVVIRPESRIIRLLLANRVDEACRIAYRRLRASGLVPLPTPMIGRSTRAGDWESPPEAYIDGRRLAAALLIPISDNAVSEIVSMVVRAGEQRSVSVETVFTQGG